MPRPHSAAPRSVARSLRTLLVGSLLALPGLALAQGATPQTHTVKPGDTLWSLAQQYLGDPLLWPEIYRLNTDVVEDPHWIYPGEVLRLNPSAGVSAVPAQDTPAPVAAAPAEAPAGAPPAAGEPAPEAAAPAAMPAEEPAEDQAAIFPSGRRVNSVEMTLRAYTERNYRPLRRSEFYRAGFLTEGQRLPFGRVLGRTAPSQINARQNNGWMRLYDEVALSPPPGAQYNVGDSLLLATLPSEIEDYGDVVHPTGVVRVIRVDAGRPIGSVVQAFDAITLGQYVLPLEAYADGGNARAVPVADGVEGRVIGWQDRMDLTTPQKYLFLDRGRKDGLAKGDLVELRRKPGLLKDGTVATDEPIALLQVVHVRDRSATAIVLTERYGDIPVGTRARQVAKLPS